jgi:DNA-binding response OmpR family regulator
MIPHINGFEVCRRLRALKIMTPILIITARDTLEDKINGLDSGADDYIIKPFQIAELLARARALLRRGTSSPPILSIADLSLDPATRLASRAGKNITLSATEYSLLEYLMRNAGRVMTRSMILEHVWQYDFDGNDNVLDVYINYLRNKIDKGRSIPLIHTIRSVGYRMGIDDPC